MVQILLVAEAELDATVARDLSDRVFSEKGPDWLTEDLIPNMRRWRGIAPETPFTPWKSLKKELKAAPIRQPRYLGFSNGAPAGVDAAGARKLVLAVREIRKIEEDRDPLIGTVLIRDLDNQPARRNGLARAREEGAAAGLTVVLATPDPKLESWILAGFEPETENEKRILKKEHQALGFDPRAQAERLRGGPQRADLARDSKRILRRLLSGSGEAEIHRREACWRITPMDTLRNRGAETGLPQFLDAVQTDLLPRVIGQQ